MAVDAGMVRPRLEEALKRVKLKSTTIYIPVEDPDGDIVIDDGLLEMTLLAAQCMAKVSDECGAVHEAHQQAEHQYETMTLEELRAPPVRTRPRGYRR
jgi:hypothetical protein